MPSEDASDRYAYLDASAIVKLVIAEPETAALEADAARRAGLLTSRLGLTEVRRAARRVGGRRLVQQVEDVLEALVVLEMTTSMFDRAANLVPTALRTLDALHVAAALELDLPSTDFITYDARLAEAARRHGLSVVVPR
jgi:hypothetical protein